MSVIERLLPGLAVLPAERFLTASGRVTRFDGQVIECHGFPVSVGAICAVEGADGSTVDAEVIGFREGRNLLFLHEFGARIEVGARVRERDEGREVAVGDGLLGRVVDARGA
ncbi:MAG: flagellar protein export ATPase FliI, partial [Pseudomonadota bacterium]